MKVYNIVFCLLVTYASAFQDCLFRDPEKWTDVFSGFSYGLKGNLTLTTDCV